MTLYKYLESLRIILNFSNRLELFLEFLMKKR